MAKMHGSGQEGGVWFERDHKEQVPSGGLLFRPNQEGLSFLSFDWTHDNSRTEYYDTDCTIATQYHAEVHAATHLETNTPHHEGVPGDEGSRQLWMDGQHEEDSISKWTVYWTKLKLGKKDKYNKNQIELKNYIKLHEMK